VLRDECREFLGSFLLDAGEWKWVLLHVDVAGCEGYVIFRQRPQGNAGLQGLLSDRKFRGDIFR
jgi:hypothetical protein